MTSDFTLSDRALVVVLVFTDLFLFVFVRLFERFGSKDQMCISKGDASLVNAG